MTWIPCMHKLIYPLRQLMIRSGTIITFSATLIWLGFPRQGIWMRQQEILDYLALWRLVAHYIGTPTEYFETPERAKSMMESLLISVPARRRKCWPIISSFLCKANPPPTHLEIFSWPPLGGLMATNLPMPWVWAVPVFIIRR
jgi:hypothetical protein